MIAISQSFRTTILYILPAFLLQSCSFIDEDLSKTLWDGSKPQSESTSEIGEKESTAAAKTTKVPVESMTSAKERTLSDVEVIWQIPDAAVDGYIIKYGTQRENLDLEIKLKTAQLEKFEDKQHGFVFRHILTGIPLNKTIYVSIAAFEGEVVSKPSQIIEVRSQSVK